MKKLVFILIGILLLGFQGKAQLDSANFIYEAPMEYRGGQLYSNFVKIRLIDNTVIPTTSHSQSIKGTSAIAAPSLKLIFDSHVLAASGDPANVGFTRQNLDDYVHVKGAEEIFEVYLGVTMNVDNLIAELRTDPNIESVNPPYCIYADGVPNNNLGLAGNPFANWHIDRIQAPEAWVFMQPYATTPQTVAVVDGDAVGAQVYEPHTWLSGKVVNEPPVNANCPTYGNHPTMVASCITAKECASACNQAVGAGRNFVNVSSHGHVCGVNNAFLEIWNMPALTRPKVINCSWVFLYNQLSPPFPPIGAAKFYNGYSSINLNTVVLEQLIASGTIVVASSGNGMSAPNSCSTSPYCFSLRGVGYPFGLPGVIGVGATSPNNMIHPGYEFGMGSGDDPINYPAGTSSGGNWNYNYNSPTLTDPIDIANQNTGYLDITAPGDEIDVAAYSGTPYTLTGAGTSFASPIVAAAAASMLLVNPALTQADVTRILTQTADKVNYNPNGMTLGDLNGSVPYTKGYTYSNNGNVSAGGFYDPTLDYVMGHGRLNMLSAVMNSAGLTAGGFTVTNSGSFPVTNVVVHDVNDHSYLTGSSYNLDYEYDAIMNQNGSNVYFNSSAVSLKIDQDATFRIMNGSKMNFTSNASLLLVTGTAGKGTKYVIGNGGTLALNDNTFNINGNAYLEAAGSGSLTINNATVVVQSGGTLHIKSNAYLSLTSTGKIIVNNGGYVCIEPGATIVNNGVIDLTANFTVGVNPAVNTPPGSGCLPPCDIIANTTYSGSGTLPYTTCLAITGSTVTNVSCLAANSGSIAVSIAGGTLPYSYAWSNSATTSSITGLAAGNYTVTVTDAASNTITAVYTVGAAATVTATASATNVFCMGGLNSGTASAGLLGGTAPYTYSWSTVPTQTTQVATGLAVGIYTVTVTDLLGCSDTETISVINDPVNSPMTITVNTSSVSCPGGTNGSATVTVVGGNQTMSPTFSAYWYNAAGGPFANTHVPSGLAGGNYTVSVVDGSGCTQTATLTIAQPAAFSPTVTMTPATSCTATTGSATITLTGGTPAYSYSWNTSPVQTASVATGLAVGIYSVTVTDSHSCTTTASVMVTNSSLVASATTTNVSCYGFTDGIATATVISGGTPPYTYQWGASAGFQTTQTVSSLGAGAYYVMVTDALGNCGNALVNITAPTSIVSTSFVTSYFCNGATIVTFPSGGTGPYTYTWSPGGQTTQTITGVPGPGYYSAVITDSHGCRSDAAPYYYGYATYIPAMPPLMITATYTSAVGSCTATNASASVSSIFNGSAPYSYLWSNGGTTQTVTGLSTGVYWVQVTDANGCAATTTINITNSSGPTLTESHTNATCSSSTGSATVTPIGGTAPYTYAWSGGQSTQSVSGLAVGTYSVLVTDAAGKCNSISVTINPPTPMSFTMSKTNVSCSPGSDGTASVGSIFGGTGGPYTYSWSPGGQTTQTATGLTAGNYTVQVTDAGGCVSTGTINLPVPGISFYYGRTNVTCYGGNNGTAYFGGFYPGGSGTPPYTYLWAPGSQTTSAVSGLSAGNYTFTVTDAGACTSSLVVNIAQPNQIVLSTTNNPNTNGCTSPNGVASVAVSSGGTGPFTYLWNTVPAQTTPAAINLLGGVYTCTVTDVSACTSIATVTVGGTSTFTMASVASPTAICAGGSSTLTASGASSYTWQPGGLNTSTISVSPSSTTVYTATGAAGSCTASVTQTLVVNPAPSVSVSPTFTNICSGQTTTLTASGASTYSWSPGTGLGATTGSTVTASPTVTTIYTVTGTSAAGCTGQAVVTVSVNAMPTLTVSPSIVKICIGQSATLTACCAGSYSWIPSTSLSTTTGSVTVASPTTTTSYTVIGTSGSCTVQAVRDVSVAPLPSLTLTPTSATICSGSGATFTVSGAATYSWSPGSGLSSTTASVVTASPTTTTIYTVTGTTGGCSSQITGTVTVLPAPSLSVSPTSATLCSGQTLTLTASGAVTYTWSPTTGLDLTAINNAIETAFPTSSIVYTVTGTGANGCTAQAAVSLTVFATPSLTISPATVTLCAGSSATLTASGGTTYTWSPGTGLNTTSGSSVIATPATTTSYTVTSTNANGCTGQAVRTVSVFALPSVSVAPTTATICSGASQSFTASGASTYSWTPSTGLSATTGSVVNASPGSTTVYTVTGTNASGCSAKAVFTLTVKPTPTVSISPNPATYCIGNPVVLQASGATTYSWSPGTGLSATTGNSVSASPTVTTVYTATGTTNGCSGTGTVQVIMSANSCTSAVAIISSPTSYASSTNLGFSSPASMAIMADITFTAGTSSINCNDVRIAPGHQIIVKNGATLSIAASWLHSCSTCGSGMWSGIYVENGGHLNLSGYDVIEDAVNAVTTQSYTSGTLVPDLQIQATIFNKNTNALNLNLGNPNNVQSLGTANIVDNCVFTCRNLSSLASPVPSITNFTAVKSALYNNTGTYGTTTTNAGVRSASGFSLTGAGTTTYPYVIGEAATTTTAGVGAINVYDYLDYGIWAKNSVFEVKNNFFQNLTGNNVSTPFGVGVYEATTNSGYPVSIGSSLTTAGANEGNVFKTCLRAIDLTGTDLVYIYNNTVNNAATSTYSNFVTTGNWSGQYGAFLKPTGTSTTVIHVEGNSISNCALGLHINRSTNYGGTSTTISTNTITAGGTSSLYCNKGVFLEDATGCSSCMGSRTMQILSNTITYAEDKAIHCSNIQSGLLIRCNNELSVTYKSVTNNTITTNSTNDVIRLDNCKNTYTEYNSNIRTSGGNTSVANSNITGIFVDNSGATGNNNAVSFNTINYVGSCAVWEGDNSTAATFGYNQMKTGRHGLYMYTNAKFSNQGSSTSPSGNRWGNPALTNHTYVDNGGYDYNLTTSIGKIYVYNGGISGGVSPVPTVNSGAPAYNVGTTTAFGIIKISGFEVICANCGCDGGGRGGRPAGEETTEIKEVVYNTMKPANIRQVLEWNERSEGLYAKEQQWSGEKWAYGLLSADPSLRQDNKDLKDFYLRMQNSNVAKFTEAESNINAGKFEAAAAEIQSIQPANLQEENLKQVYTILLNLVQHPEGLTAADRSTLWSIAGQCRHTGGEAVMKARALNNRLYNQAMVYTDACEPENTTLRQDNTATEAGILFNIYPNPGNGEVTVDYDGLNGQDATLSIYDVNGGLLHSTTLPANSNRVQLHAKDLANGVYMYKVTSNAATLKTGKIIILK